MAYSVKELFYTLQGEGAHSGRAAVFCRFTGCNLWSGREEDREKAVCRFCDTDFVGTDGPGGGKFDTPQALAAAVRQRWLTGVGEPAKGAAPSRTRPYVVCTGGEPLLQLDAPLVDALHAAGFEVAVETNGTVEPPAGLDWICVSPKSTAPLKLTRGHELKLVYPQADAPPERFSHLDFQHFFLQPMDGLMQRQAMRQAAAYCMANPAWRLCLQTHKVVGFD
jgi:7-carboxy-7-deazaguanine synthase